MSREPLDSVPDLDLSDEEVAGVGGNFDGFARVCACGGYTFGEKFALCVECEMNGVAP